MFINTQCTFVLLTFNLILIFRVDIIRGADCLNEQDNPLVETIYGKVQGKLDCDSSGNPVEVFLGIPFTKPPVGQLRFKYPVPPEKWDGILATRNFSKSCKQIDILKPLKNIAGVDRIRPFTSDSEDCLYLNVWRPRQRSNETSPIPVVVFIHGGAFTIGSTATKIHNPLHLVSQEGIIFVTFNYRLSAFGFMYLNDTQINANAGFLDQVEALKWVRDNIAAFGGDPQKVTLAGQSAGAMSAGFHLLSPLSKNLFHKIILESGTPLAAWIIKSKQYVEKVSKELISNLGCSNKNQTLAINCLMSADAQDIIDSEPRLDYDMVVFYPVIDGVFLVEEPLVTIENYNFKKADMLIGLNKDEGTAILSLTDPLMFSPASEEIYPTQEDKQVLVRKLFLDESEIIVNAVFHQYSSENQSSPQILEDLTTALSDYVFNCPSNRISNTYVKSGSKVFGYLFTHRSVNSKNAKWLGVVHGEELHYVFGFVQLNDSTYNEEDRKLGKQIMRYFANFVRTGDPNESPSSEAEQNTPEMESIKLSKWPAYTNEEKQLLILEPNPHRVVSNYKKSECRFWDILLPYLKSL